MKAKHLQRVVMRQWRDGREWREGGGELRDRVARREMRGWIESWGGEWREKVE